MSKLKFVETLVNRQSVAISVDQITRLQDIGNSQTVLHLADGHEIIVDQAYAALFEKIRD